jgi:hypothetical protein
MPTKLESLKAEQKRLNGRKNLSPSDEKRLATLSRLIRQEERKEVGFGPQAGGYAVPKGASYLSPWKTSGTSGGSYRSADNTVSSVANKRDQIRMAMGMSPLADLGFLTNVSDDPENPVIGVDPNLKGYTFGPSNAKGGLFGPAQAAARSVLKGTYANTPGSRDVTAADGMSVKQMMDFYYSMNDAELIQFQHHLVEAGLLEKPTLGFRDPSTTKALGLLMRTWMSEPSLGIKELLGKLKAANSARLQEAVQERMRERGSGTGVISDEVANITVTDAQTLDSMVDKVAVNLVGQFIDPEQKAAIIKQLQDEERSFKTSQVQADFDSSVFSQEQQIAAAGGNANDLDAFMTALIGQESGGNPNAVNADSGAMGVGQIMPENWGPWSAEAGVDSRDFSEANQRRVIKYKLAQYYEAYGNWRDVAIAWYGGHGGVLRARGGGGNNPEGAYPSLNAYADQVLAQMNSYTGAQLTEGRKPQLHVNVGNDLADAQTRAEAKIKNLDPAAYAGSEFAKRAEVFFNLLGGVN